MARTPARILAAAGVIGLSSLGLATPAFAVCGAAPTYASPCPVSSPVAAPVITVTQAVAAEILDDVTLAVGQAAEGDLPAGSFDDGSKVEVGAQSTYYFLGFATADSDGSLHFDFALPAALPAGAHHIVAKGTLNGVAHTISIPFTATGLAFTGGAVAGGKDSLPFTGAEVGVAALLGAGLIGAGSIAIVSGRRRRAVAA